MHRSFFEKRAGKKSHTPEKKICQNCGHVNQGTALFCAECGTKLLAEPVTTQVPTVAAPQKRKSGKVFVIAALAVVVVVAGAIGISWSSKTAYTAAVNQAETAMEERNYTAAIDSLKIAVEKKPRNPEAYRMLATAYTENQELYEAREILKMGYQKTKDVSLKKVSIWGPMSAVDIAYWHAKGLMPITHMEYVFEGDFVAGYQSIAIQNQRETRYHFNENGQIICAEIGEMHPNLDYWSSPSSQFGLGDFTLLDWLYGYEWLGWGSAHTEELYYTYDINGQVESVEEKTGYVTMDFTYDKNQRCNRVIWDVSDGEFTKSIDFRYGSDSRISEIKTECFQQGYDGWQSLFKYREDGGWDVTNMGKTYQMSFDSEGRILSMDVPQWSEWLKTTLDESDRITKITWTVEDNTYTYDYSYFEDGRLDRVACHSRNDVEGIYSDISASCSYNEDGFLTGIDYELEGSGQPISVHRDILYLEDKNDIRIFGMEQETDVFYNFKWGSRYFYDDNGELDFYEFEHPDGAVTEYVMYYDEYGIPRYDSEYWEPVTQE